MEYTEQELVAVAKREKNTRRGYLVVNRLQGKHIPVSPGKALAMFDCLAELLLKEYEGERLLLVGFAETATAVGAAAAVKLGACYIQTTRERIEGADYFYFTEQHSHAVEQKLVRADMDRAVEQVDRVIFMEDEITTGQTILNIIELLEETYPGRLRFSAASLLNGMDSACRRRYEERGIRLHWLLKTCQEDYEARASVCPEDGNYIMCDFDRPQVSWKEYPVPGLVDARRLTQGKVYKAACERMAQEALGSLPPAAGRRILVIGTEEFMYPALWLGALLEREGGQVRCHSTTRSPIAVSSAPGYPLHDRYELRSLYDSGRVTFLYELSAYDEAVIVTDAEERGREGLYSLIHALAAGGNERIHVIRWRP